MAAYVDLNEFEKTVITAIDAARPTGIDHDHIQYPNLDLKNQPNHGSYIQVLIKEDDRDRVTLGTGEFEINGELQIIIYSPVGKGSSENRAIVLAYRQVFDDIDLSFTGGSARFRATEIQSNGEDNGFFSTTIICPFFIREIVSNISTSLLTGLDQIERIKFALIDTTQANVEDNFTIEVVTPDYIKVVDHPTNPYATLEIRNGQPLVNSGIRAEAVVDFPFVQGDIIQYEWRIRLPTGYTNDAAGGNRFWIVGQWHDKPIPPATGGTGNSPPISFGLGDVSGVSNLSFLYLGATAVEADLIPLPADTWVDFKVVVGWSETVNGYADVFIDGLLHQQETGANMLNSLNHFFKVGHYRHADITGTNFIHVDDIRIENIGTFTP